MEDMEIDQIVDVPDTPDRLITRHDDRKYVRSPDVVDVMYTNEKRDKVFPVADTTKNRRLAFRPLKNSYSDEISNCSNYITVSPSEKSYPSQNVPIFRRGQTDKIFGHGKTHSNGAEKMEKGKNISSKFPSKSSHHGLISVLDLTEENGQSQQLKSAFSHRGSKDNATEDKKELKASIGNSSLPFIADSSKTSSNTFTGWGKTDNKTLPGPNIFVDRGKSIAVSNDSQPQLKTEKQVTFPSHLPTAPRARGQKRLVRNGCISPHNIATRAKQSAEQNSHQMNDVEQTHAGHSVSSDEMSLISIVDDIVAEEKDRARVKGKEVLIHPSSVGHNVGTIHPASSSPVINYEDASGTNNVIRNSLKNSGGQGGWRTTYNHKNSDQRLCDVNGHHLRRNDDVGRFTSRQYTNRIDGRDTGSSQNNDVHIPLIDHAAQATSLIIPEVGQSTGTRPTADTQTKRQRKRGSTSRNPNEASYNSEIMFLSSSGESSISSLSRSYEFDPQGLELLSYTNRASQHLDDTNNNNSDAQARQVEADEILARELQEQLYHEDSFEGREIDEHLAWKLQHEENLLHTSTDSHPISHPTLLPRAPSNRQPRSRPHQNPSTRRRAVPQVPSSNRVSQLRSRILSRSPTPTMSSRGRRPRFPLDMDLDMRLDILEALEDAVGDLGVMPDDIIRAHRDFNEADYEMLLLLDEQNHQHTGSSANLINSLPQSTIQTDNFSEACAVCLETPVKGEVIRHLPCLHKYHKDCIDPWLQRKTSCPVCKSSIT